MRWGHHVLPASLTHLPLHVTRDSTLRVKVIDACGMTCTFCHNEGTPVYLDNRDRTGGFLGTGRSGRRSIYATTNGAAFLPAPVAADDAFRSAIARVRDAMNVHELHLTGGEPTLHPALPALIRIAVDEGFTVCMTSNGERGEHVLAACAEAGLDRVNFSIFGTTAAELAQVQNARYRSPELAQRKIDALRASITTCTQLRLKARANVVVPDTTHIDRVHRLLDEFTPQLRVRLLNSLAGGSASLDAISELLAQRGAVPESRHVVAGVSGARTSYRLPDNRLVQVKEIRRVRLPRTCVGCPFNNDTDCQEGFYGLRLYRDRAGRYLVGVCLQRMDLCTTVEQFVDSPLHREIIEFRDAEYRRLTSA